MGWLKLVPIKSINQSINHEPKFLSCFTSTQTWWFTSLEIVFVRADASWGILVWTAGKCVYVAYSASAGWKLETILIAKQEGEFPTQLIKWLIPCQLFLKTDIKTNEQRDTLYEQCPVSAARSNFTNSSPGAELQFLLILSFPTFTCPISHPLVHQLSLHLLGACKSLHFSKAQIPIPSHSPFPPR